MPNARICYLIVWLAMLNAGPLAAKTNYVDASGPGGDGSSWSQAYTNLQTAIAAAVANDQIWVAQGTYYPTNGTDRSATFQPSVAVAFYGGFTNGMTSLSARDWNRYPTILSGDIGAPGDITDNINRILTVFLSGVVVNGFIITGANGVAAGGGLYASGMITLENCTFRNNFAGQQGAAVYAQADFLTTNCVFSYNQVTNCTAATHGGGAIYCSVGQFSRNIEGCLFTANRAEGSGQGFGGAIYFNKDCPSTISNSVFVGNQAASRGGAISYGETYPAITQTGAVVNCAFIGNKATSEGGAVCGSSFGSFIISMLFKNCTLSGNTAGSADGGIYARGTVNASIENCICWSTRAAADTLRLYTPATMTVRYSDLKGGTNAITLNAGATLTDGGGIIDTDPFYAAGSAGAWTAAGAYDAAAGKTTLYRTGAGWTPGAWAGAAVNPDTNQALKFYVVTNVADTATVWGDASALATNGAAYLIADYHEQSSVGRWTPLGWAGDAQYSPCIDAGDPASAYENEPRPNGRRINLGAYGNTSQASKSIIARGTIVMGR